MSRLGPEETASYRERGFLRVPQLLGSAEVAALQQECDRVVAEEARIHGDDEAARESFQRHSPAGRPVRNLIDPIVPRSALIRELLGSEAVTAILENLLGDAPRLFKDKLILRPPGTAGYGLHQDFAYWGWTGASADQLIALQIAIDDADATNGALQICKTRHDRLLTPTENSGNDLSLEALGGQPELVPMRAGDALLFHPLTPHRSDTNRSERFRRTLYLTYNAAAAGDLYRVYYQDRAEVVSAFSASGN